MKITYIENDKFSGEIDLTSFPDECPICHYNISPKPIVMAGNKQKKAALFLCPNKICGNFFISYYTNNFHSGSYPQVFVEQQIPDSVRRISDSFVKIYNEAKKAESESLLNIYGISLRKALEFLVKDYCIAETPSAADAIRSETLAKCIAKYIDNSNIKDCASRAAWIGNDETHYNRIWADKDATDLDKIIKLTVSWMDSCLITKELLESMKK
jgi:hypothetical protein